MSLNLNSLSSNDGARKKKQRIGRGVARKGMTSGRGRKGQRARAGGKGGLKLMGMKQTLMRVPKLKGFKSNRPKPAIVNLKDLSTLKDSLVTPGNLKKAGIVDNAKKKIKILSDGEVKTSFVVRGIKVSEAAKAKIEAAGGKVE